MAAPITEVLGIVHPDGSLELSARVTVPPGRVRVRIESLEPQPEPAEDLIEFVRRTRRELEAAGHRFRTQEEIDAELEQMRNEWDERLDMLDALPNPPSQKEEPGC